MAQEPIAPTNPASPGGGPGYFATTRWSVVLAAGEEPSPQAEAAVAQLCRTYWYPLYAFVRQEGLDPHDAEDMTQGFFLHLLQRRDLARVRREKGRFRSFLLVSLKHFLVNEWKRARAEKRGGRNSFVPLAGLNAEDRYAAEGTDDGSPERVFDRHWALALIETVLASLREEYESSGRAKLFELLQPFLSGQGASRSQAEIGTELGLNENAVKQAVHRLRQRYRECLRDAVAHTVAQPGDVEDELRYLIEVLRE
jgi:RNA polymerase sigma-70 factor (ECF subfamily)